MFTSKDCFSDDSYSMSYMWGPHNWLCRRSLELKIRKTADFFSSREIRTKTGQATWVRWETMTFSTLVTSGPSTVAIYSMMVNVIARPLMRFPSSVVVCSWFFFSSIHCSHVTTPICWKLCDGYFEFYLNLQFKVHRDTRWQKWQRVITI